jgi:uncharacterized protein involved in exopolysaccharide biosynthesis
MDQQENPEKEQELSAPKGFSTEESFRRTVEKLRPYLTKLWGVRKKFLYVNGVVAIVAVLYLLFLTKPYYDSTVTILPNYGTNASMLSQLSGLASLAGVSVGNATPTQIYQELLTSESVLAPVIYAKYKTEEFPDSVNLIEYDKIKPDESLPPDLQRRKMFLKEFDKLTKSAVKTDVDRITQILTVTVRMPEGQLSADVANKTAKSLDNYIQTQMRTSAKDQRIYIEKRMGEVKDSLTKAENALTSFNERNNNIAQSPMLQLEQSRLQRNVSILNAVYLQLAQQAELAKIQEVKDTPVINLEEAAANPVIKTGPKRAVTLIIIMFFSVLISAGYLIFDEKIKEYYWLLRGK